MIRSRRIGEGVPEVDSYGHAAFSPGKSLFF